MAVLNTKAACDARFLNNQTNNNTPGPVTYGVSVADNPAAPLYAGDSGTVGTISATVSGNSKGPFPWLEQDQQY